MAHVATKADLYFTRLRFPRSVLRNPYELHRRLWLCFPGMPEAERPFLFHVAYERNPAEVLMQSVLAPTQPARRDVKIIDVRACCLDLVAGALHRFILTANPARRVAATGKRVALGSAEERCGWLGRRLDSAAEIVEVQVTGRRVLRFYKKKHAGEHVAVNFAGVLRVLDPDALAGLIMRGVGPARSFGCGLLVLSGG